MRSLRTWIISVSLACSATAALAAGQGGVRAPLPNDLEITARGIHVRYPAGWTVGPRRYTNADELWQVPAAGKAARRDTRSVLAVLRSAAGLTPPPPGK